MNIRQRAASIGATALIIGAGLIGIAGSASAHTTGLTGASVCDTTTGTFTVTWTGTTSQVPAGKTGTVTATTPNAGATLTVPPAPIAANAGYTITETGVPTTAGTAQVDVHIAWSDGYSLNQVSALTVGGNCAIAIPSPSSTPTPTDTPTPPAATNPGFFDVDPTCGQITYTLGANQVWAVQRDGVTIDNITGMATRTYTVPGVYTLLDNGGSTSGSTVTVIACAAVVTPTPTPSVTPTVQVSPIATATATPVAVLIPPTSSSNPAASPVATLPFTGSNIGPTLIVGAGLVLAGAAALGSLPFLNRRKARHSA